MPGSFASFQCGLMQDLKGEEEWHKPGDEVHLCMGLEAPRLLHFSTNCIFTPGTFLGIPKFIGLLAILGRLAEDPLQGDAGAESSKRSRAKNNTP